MKLKKEFDVFNYIQLVEEIVAGYFDDDGRYIPHYGKINAFRVFYNKVVIDDILDGEGNPIEHNADSLFTVETLMKNPELTGMFKTMISSIAVDRFALNFENAYREAMDMVGVQKSEGKKLTADDIAELINKAIDTAVDRVETGIISLSEIIKPVFDKGFIDKYAELMDGVKTGELTPEKIVEAFSNSERFREILNRDEGNNVIQLDGNKDWRKKGD